MAATATSLASSASWSCSALSPEGPNRSRPVARQLVPQLLDQHRLSLHLGDQETGQRLQVPRIVREWRGLVEHGRS